MRFRHALAISIDNFSSVFKLLLYRLVTTVIFVSIGYVILTHGLHTIVSSAEVQHLKQLLGGFVQGLFTGNSEFLQSFQGDMHVAIADVVRLVANNSASIIGCAVALVLVYLVNRFVSGLAVFATGSVIGDRMATYSRTSFSQAYFKNLGNAALYGAIYVPLCFVYDALTLLACWFFFFFAPSFFPSWGILSALLALSLTMTAIVCLQALKMTFISYWMPAVHGGMKVGEAFKASFRAVKGFGGRFANFLMSVYLIVVVNAVCGLVTFGSALLLTIPLSYVFLLCMQFVNYFRTSGQKYFVTLNRIAEDETIEAK